MSDKPQVRKRQPELVRQQLLQSAARLATELGVGAVTVSAVAQAAGVTKGGFFHHFPSKQALIEGLFDDMLQQLDSDIDQFIAEDPLPYGSFTRAYVKVAFLDNQQERGWAALSFTMLTDVDLTVKWDSWLAKRLEKHQQTDSDAQLEVIRLAADGVWLASLVHRSKKFCHAESQLLSMTLGD
ncbi:AcrR family transcriptional regulator [Erwinia toletana]|uniref:AcrR family transcriptional regulator n=1 Tax=Winslowiella toletana TaxID=92490 RepID=A0ABS4P872_9GAMM|nr:TetR/AcrR family transcriptional regulator [Winslowiella toletana]MBP2168841.1 AcrR family transcriptional regulator [Winslowiella toletana]